MYVYMYVHMYMYVCMYVCMYCVYTYVDVHRICTSTHTYHDITYYCTIISYIVTYYATLYYSNIGQAEQDSHRGSCVDIGTMQTILAWPPRKDDTRTSKSVNIHM